MAELELSSKQISLMVAETLRGRDLSVSSIPLTVLKSDSYGEHLHRTWVFFSDAKEIVGSIERYWGGLKMVCSVFGEPPRTKFFMEDGHPTTNRTLKGL